MLFVCTGNVCRSPVAQGLTTAWVARTAGAEAPDVEVLSAGTAAPAGRPMDERSASALARLGGDPTGHRARILTPDLAAGADLVLTMTRRHRRAVLEMAPRGLRRTFTLLEAADLLRATEAPDLAALPADERVLRLGRLLDAGRRRRSSSASDDVPDPVGRPAGVHDAVADTIASALHPLLAAVFPPAPRTPIASGTEGLRSWTG